MPNYGCNRRKTFSVVLDYTRIIYPLLPNPDESDQNRQSREGLNSTVWYIRHVDGYQLVSLMLDENEKHDQTYSWTDQHQQAEK